MFLIRSERINTLSIDEFLLAVYKQKKQTNISNRSVFQVDSVSKKVKDEFIVCFYLGLRSVQEVITQDISYLSAKLEFIRQCFSHVRGVVLWWLDDGLLPQMIREYENALLQGHKPGWIKDEQVKVLTKKQVAKEREHLKKIMVNYEKEIEVFKHDSVTIYDDSGDVDWAIDRSSACYAEESVFTKKFRETGKFVGIFELAYVGDGRIDYGLSEWLTYFINEKEVHAVEINGKMKQQGKRLILGYVCNAGILYQGSDFFEVWHTFLVACKMQGLAVWWLHDSSLSTLIEYMQEPAKNKYLELRKWAELDNDILIDASGDLEHAIRYCDAYYGSPAGCAVSEAAQGLPVVWYGYGRGWPHECCAGSGQGMLMSFINGCHSRDKFYFTHWYVNGLFSTARGSDRAEFVTRLPFNTEEKRFLSSAIFQENNILYIIPTNASEILAWNMITKEWQNYEINPRYAKSPYVWFIGAFEVDGCLWLKPVNYAAMVCFNLSDNSLSYFTDWGKEVWDMEPDANNQYWGEAVLIGKDIWIGAKQSGYIMKFSTEEHFAEMYYLSDAASGIRSLSHDGEDFWIYTMDCNLLRWYPQSGVRGIWTNPLGEGKGGAIICKCEKVWLFEHLSDSYVMIDIQSGEFTYKEHYLSKDLRKGLGYMHLFQDESDIYIHPNGGELIICFNPRTQSAEACSWRMSKSSETEYAVASFNNMEAVGEGMFYDLYELVMYLRMAGKSNICMNIDKLVGKKIYDRIIGSI